MPPAVLLVGPHATAWAERVPPATAEVTAAPTQAEARAYLGGTGYDIVFVEDAADIAPLRALRDVLGLNTRIETADRAEDVLGWLSEPPAGRAADWDTELMALRDELSRVAHSLNNPLAVIVGNAQLGLELAAALGTDEGVVEALQNVSEAAADLGDLFREIADLRARVERLTNAR